MQNLLFICDIVRIFLVFQKMHNISIFPFFCQLRLLALADKKHPSLSARSILDFL